MAKEEVLDAEVVVRLDAAESLVNRFAADAAEEDFQVVSLVIVSQEVGYECKFAHDSNEALMLISSRKKIDLNG